MFLLDASTVVYSASDLTAAATCEWATMHTLDAILGRVPRVVVVEDEMLKRTSTLGDAHERRVLEGLLRQFQVVEIERPARSKDVAEAAALTAAAFASGAEVIFQAAFFDGRFLGYADFIIRGEDGAYEVYDTKLARHAKITALLQLAAYSDQLQRIGVPTGDNVHLWLGDLQKSTHRLRDILPVYRRRRARLERIIDERIADVDPTLWGDPRYEICGRCDACSAEIEAHHDVLLVAGLRLTQRDRLRAAGIETIEQLAAAEPIAGLTGSTFAALRDQAALQLEPHTAESPLPWKVIEPRILAALPEPDPGDIFFDFEGDPLHQEGNVWGLDYLFGLVETDETFRAFWAHNLAEEKRALVDFLGYVARRRERHPNLHIYHYASYERTHLLTLAARHGVGEAAVAELLREGVLVDLYPIVRRGLLIGSHSYSLKKLEPLYMGDEARAGVANAADSITEYVRSRELLEAGCPEEAQHVLEDIARYNTYDCVSTLRLRDWLLAHAPVELAATAALFVPNEQPDPDPLYAQLMQLIDGTNALDRSPEQRGIALAAAALDYHRRENNSFWWDHFARLRDPIDEWENSKDVFRVETVRVERDWSVNQGDRAESRDLRLVGTPAPGSSFAPGSKNRYFVYEQYCPAYEVLEPGARYAHSRSVILEADEVSLLIRERAPMGGETPSDLPMALTPSAPPSSTTLVSAIHDWAQDVYDAWPEPVQNAAMDVLRRQPPRTVLAPVTGQPKDAILESLRALDRSYLAVQGPPGTGKTYVGSHVISELVSRHGWKIGVVAQSHAVVENMLNGIVKAGLDPARVGKQPQTPGEHSWTKLTAASRGKFLAQPGYVIGGTMWLFSNTKNFARGELDLLVVDEAGQYSLANTIAASVSATRLLLLGDPQQLPQVTNGTHPEPVDASALGWLTEGHDVLPPELGYFLETSWRMHPAVCAPVSRLSYEGKLHSHSSDRHLAGIEPGLCALPVVHSGNATASTEEADTVMGLIAQLLGTAWSAGGVTAPLGQGDIIVVAPYNAQVELVRQRLDLAGYCDIPVGTVDKFQGREAAVSIVTLAASSSADIARGLEFLLLANRLNVAISRAQWVAYLVYSPALTEALPTSVGGLAQLSAFIELVSARQ